MSILTGPKIKAMRDEGLIQITPWSDKNLGPNSYNLTLADTLLWFSEDNRKGTFPLLLTPDVPQPGTEIKIPKEGLILLPGFLYLGRTVEYTRTDGFVPMLEGRSSVGRLGIAIHVTAGFGDDGFAGFWTLEIFCVQPVILYPGIPIAQIYYHSIEGVRDPYNSDKYQNNKGIQESQLWKDIRELKNGK